MQSTGDRAVCAWVIGDGPVWLWGLSSRERLARLLRRAGVTHIGDPDDMPSTGDLPSSVVVARGDYLYDDRVVTALVGARDVLLVARDGQGSEPVAAHVALHLAGTAREVLAGARPPDALPRLRVESPETLAPAYQKQLRKREPAFVRPVRKELRRELEERLFSGAYKGVTDLVTKWVWPRPARWVTRLCTAWGLRPNHVTLTGLALVVAAGLAFASGRYGWGLLAGWLMTFLDTVDGKLARVTVTSSRAGHLLDHGMDIVHPPLWYLAWGIGLGTFDPGLSWLSLYGALVAIVGGYVVGRLVEGTFHLWVAPFSIFSWRPADSYFRLVTARRNPNLLLLSGGALVGRPDLGLVAVAAWTMLSSVLLLARLALAIRTRLVSGPLRSWLVDANPETRPAPLAVRWFVASGDRR